MSQEKAHGARTVMPDHPDDADIPDHFMCPISYTLMQDPVICRDGHSYERAALERWFEMNEPRSPRTNEPLADKTIIPNQVLRSQITEYMEAREVDAKYHHDSSSDEES